MTRRTPNIPVDLLPPAAGIAGAGSADCPAVLADARDAGRRAAAALPPDDIAADVASTLGRRIRNAAHAIEAKVLRPVPHGPHHDWLVGNARLMLSIAKDLRTFAQTTKHLPTARVHGGRARTLRVLQLMEAFAELESPFSDASFGAFIDGVHGVVELRMGELWAAKPALQLVHLERLAGAVASQPEDIPRLLTSLRALTEARWTDVFAAANLIDPVLAVEPALAYGAMDDESRDLYRQAVADLAEHSGRREREVAEQALALARAAAATGLSDRAAMRRAHVGTYLIDEGRPLLEQRLGYRQPFAGRLRNSLCAHPTAFYFGSIAALTTVIVLCAVAMLDRSAAMLAALLLLLPASQTAIEIVNHVMVSIVGPRRLPRLDFVADIPDEHATLVAVPALLLDERHARELVMDLEIRYLANRDRNLSFALITNSRDAERASDERHDALRLCQRLIAELNERYGMGGRTPFYLFHRFRAFNPSEGRWMGWERKRGKLLDLNQFLRGVRDRFPVKVGDVAQLANVRYVITLDSDTALPRDAAARLIGTMAHPLNRAIVDPVTRRVIKGYGILQPRIGVSTASASRSWLATLYSGDSGFDLYTRAISDIYQDLFAEGIFTGKGIYEIDAFRDTLERRFPANTLLSHDLIEGLFARVGLVSDVEFVDDYPTHFSAYCRRRHRWMRGDWQVMRWTRSRVPDYRREIAENPLPAIARWKIADNLRRSLLEPARVAVLLAGWLVPGVTPLAWTAVALLLLFAPTWWHLGEAIVRAPWKSPALAPWARATAAGFLRSHVVISLHVAYLLHDAMLAVDAIGRSLARMFVTRRRLLEWETAAEAERRHKGVTDVYLEQCSFAAAALGVLIAVVKPTALPDAAPLLLLWLSSRPIALWLNRPRRSTAAEFDARSETFLREHALRSWQFFAEFSSAANNWLVPDFVRRDGALANRLSPTNVGFLLNARIAAVHFGYLTMPEFVTLTRRTLGTLTTLQRYRGHLFNWYDAETLAVLEPRFVSTVDSGNLAATLWALKQSAQAWARNAPPASLLWDGIADVARVLGASGVPGAQTLSERVLRAGPEWTASFHELDELVTHFAAGTSGEAAQWAQELSTRMRSAHAWHLAGPSAALSARLQELADIADSLASEMDFSFLYDPRRKTLSVGCDAGAEQVERAAYDLLASESRIASFVAVAKGDVPQDSWLHLGRAHVRALGERVLLSWTGTMFEYLMPALWMAQPPGTIMYESMRAAVQAQRRFAAARHIPWGFSESGHIVPGSSEYGYAACGIPELAIKPLNGRTVVVSPYSSALALLVEPGAAIDNLRRLQALGVAGHYGFFEAIDYSDGDGQLVESWMAHHQGMTLLAIAEVLCGHPLREAFHSEPHVRATERLLEERVPRAIAVDAPLQPGLLMPEESAA